VRSTTLRLVVLGLVAMTGLCSGAAQIVQTLVLSLEGKVEVSRSGSAVWDPAYTDQVLLGGDRLRTGERSRARVRLSELTVISVGELSVLQVPPPTRKPPGLTLLRGVLHFFHRDRPGLYRFETPTVATVIRGTEFVLKVPDEGATTAYVLDGAVEMTNEAGRLALATGEASLAEAGRAPVRTPMIEAINIIQWLLYYPAVLDLEEVPLSAAEQNSLAESLAAYRSGDLLAALAKYPAGREPDSVAERVYFAALLLAVGQVERAGEDLHGLNELSGEGERARALADALRTLIAAVKLQPPPATAYALRIPHYASRWLAESYYQQSRANLPAALAAARESVQLSPNFGFGWARVAELEFSFGRIEAARAALEKGLRLVPRNAQAVALKGFLLSAQKQIDEAIAQFEQATAIDGGLGNAWLGRGLCRIRKGDSEGGRQDLQVAAALEPQRALLRSYLGKAFSQVRDDEHATKELKLAQQLDPADPTAWLYAALLGQQQNRINQAVRDLGRSQELNDNRRVYRSRLLLDQDRAVRSANLAAIYQDAGLTDVSVREAARAVNTDYGNHSAHLFLANSYDALRDPRQINLRYETAWLSEYLVANLLAPVGASPLSPYVTQQEYARLFERDRVGFSSSTEYWSRGDWFQTASQFGVFGNASYAADVAYRSETGFRPNNDVEQLTVSLKAKQQLSFKDSLYVQAIYYDAEAGDVTPYYNQRQANLGLRTKETQEPIVLAGYHHEWQPGVHTIVLAGRLEDTLRVSNPRQQSLLLQKGDAGSVVAVLPGFAGQRYRSQLDIYTAEAQQIFQRETHALIFGARYQTGEFRAENQHAITDDSFVNESGVAVPGAWFENSPQRVAPDFERMTGYGYTHWQALPSLRLIAGVSYDRLTLPENLRFAPLAAGERTIDEASPKAGLVWTPWTNTTVRAAYTRSLGGVSFDQSFQLEPTQVAGFNQAWRGVMPEAVVAANAGAEFETWGVALDQKFPPQTYVGVTAELLRSGVSRTVGVFDLPPPRSFTPPFSFPAGTDERLDYEERALTASIYQLLGQEWSVGATYRISRAELETTFRDIPATARTAHGFAPGRDERATLQQANVFGR
jgi:Tfp pilus assembly protein PilF